MSADADHLRAQRARGTGSIVAWTLSEDWTRVPVDHYPGVRGMVVSGADSWRANAAAGELVAKEIP